MELHKFLKQFNENHSFQDTKRECKFSSPNTSSLEDKTIVKRARRKVSQLDILKQTQNLNHVSVYMYIYKNV